jgi:hypothetical protein
VPRASSTARSVLTANLIVSCEAGMTCTDIDGTIGCCPEGETCDYVVSCIDYSDASCSGSTTAASGCCPSEAPYCNAVSGVCAPVPVSSTLSSSLVRTRITSTSSTATLVPAATMAASPTLTPSADAAPSAPVAPPTTIDESYIETVTATDAVQTGILTDTAEAPSMGGDLIREMPLPSGPMPSGPMPSGTPSGGLLPPYPAGNTSMFTNETGSGNMTLFTGAAAKRTSGVGAAAAAGLVGLGLVFSLM